MTTATRPRSVYWRRRAVLAGAGSVGLIMLIHSCASAGPPHLEASRFSKPVPITSTYTPTPTPTPTPTVEPDVVAEGGTAAPTAPPATPSAAPPIAVAPAAVAQTAAAPAGPTAAPTAPATPKPNRTAKPGKGKATAVPGATAAPAVAAPVAATAAAPPAIPLCGKDALEVELRSDSQSYADSSKPKFYIGIKNIGTAPCQADLGSAALTFTVRSGPDRIWSSQDCQGKATHDVRTLVPGKPLWGRSIWSLGRSKPGCPSGLPDAKPGTYILEGSAAGVKAGKRVIFRIR